MVFGSGTQSPDRQQFKITETRCGMRISRSAGRAVVEKRSCVKSTSADVMVNALNDRNVGSTKKDFGSEHGNAQITFSGRSIDLKADRQEREQNLTQGRLDNLNLIHEVRE